MVEMKIAPQGACRSGSLCTLARPKRLPVNAAPWSRALRSWLVVPTRRRENRARSLEKPGETHDTQRRSGGKRFSFSFSSLFLFFLAFLFFFFSSLFEKMREKRWKSVSPSGAENRFARAKRPRLGTLAAVARLDLRTLL